MKKYLFALLALVFSLSGMTQEIFQGSIKKNANPNQVEVVFKPNYNRAAGPPVEYVLFLQMAVSVPLGSAPVSATAQGAGTFTNMGALGVIATQDETFGTPSSADDERTYGFVYANPTASTQNWSAGVEFTGVIVTFSANLTTEAKLLDLENNGGGDNGNTYFILNTNTGGKRADESNGFPAGEGPLFFAITGSSTIGFFPHTTQAGPPDRFARTGGATTTCNAGTVSGTSPLCVGATATYSSNGDVGGTWSSTNSAVASVNVATGLVTALSAGTTNITYTVSTGCSPTATAFKTLTVNQSPTVSCPSNSSVCINAAAFALTGGLPAGGTYSGTGVSAGQFDPAAAGVGTHTITYTASESGCSSSCTFTITVNPLPTVTCPSNSSVCINAAAFGLTGGLPAGGTYSGTGVNAGQFDPAAAGAGTHTITYTASESGCSSSCTFTITVNALPVVSCPSNSSVNLNTPAFALTGGTPTGGTYSGTGVGGGQFNPATAGLGTHTITYTFTDGNGCSSSCTFTITVNPAVSVVCPVNSSVCINAAAFTLTGGLPAGGTYSGSGVSNGQFDPATAGVGAHVITYTTPNGSCTFTITVNPLPTVTCPSNSSVCINAAAFALTGGLPAGGTYSGIGVNAGQFDPAAAGAGTHTITYTASESGCSSSCTFTITVNPLPTVTCPSNSSVCINAAAFALTGGLPAGGTYSGTGVSAGQFNPGAAGAGTHTITYTASASGCSSSCTFTITVNALPVVSCPSNSSVNLNTPAFALTGGAPTGGTYSGTGVSGGQFDPATAGLGTHTITYTFTDGNGCSSSCTFTITVNPAVSVVCPVNSSVCINAAAFTLTGGLPAGGTYSGPGVSNGQFDPAAAGVGAHVITYTTPNGSCTFTITVNPLPTVTCPADLSVCISASFSLTGGTPAGGTYSGPGVSSNSFNASIAGFGTHTITYTFSDGNGCSSSCTFTITVNTPPTVTCPANSSVCFNAAAFTLTGGSPIGGVYSGLGVSNGQFHPDVAGVGTHTITYIYFDLNNCEGSCTFTITVNLLPTVTCPANSSVCVTALAFTLTGGSPAGGTYSGTGVSGGQFDPAAAGPGAHTITYTYTNPNTGCTNSCTFTITVNALPTVTCPSNSTVNLPSTPFALTGGLPAGGTYSGTGVSAGQFDPATAGLGTHTITYSYTDGNGCSSNCTFTITVVSVQVATCPANSSVCINVAAFSLTGGLPAGGTYSGIGVSGGMFDPAAAGVGTHTITYTYTEPGTTTTTTCTFTITVNPLPTVTCPASSSVCNNAAAFTLTGGSPAGGTYSGTGVSGGMFDPASAGVGTHTITYTASVSGCGNSCTFTITVNPLPTVTCPSNSSVCISAAPFALTGGLPAGGTYSGTGVSGGVFNPATAGVGTHTITFAYTDGNGCSSSCTFTITVNALPIVTCPSSSSVNLNTPAFTLTGGSPAGGNYSGTGVNAGQFDPSAAGLGTHTITYTYTDGNSCTSSCTFTITVNPAVNVVCPVNSSVCINTAAFTLTGGSPAGGTYSGTGVSGGQFDPSSAGLGTHVITYTTSSGNCTFTITVNALPTVTCPSNSSVCFSAAPFALTGGLPAGGTYSGTGVSGGVFNPAIAGAGAHTITYAYTDGNGCSNSCTFTITVNALPVITCPANSSVCVSTSAFTLTGGSPAGGTYSGNGVSGDQFDPSAAGVGTHTITYSYTDGNNCSSSCSYTITVNDAPIVTCPANPTVCINTPAFALTGGTPAGGTYSGTGVNGGVFDPASAGVGTHTITYAYSASGCSASCTFSITVNPLPTVSCPANSSVCIGDAAFTLTGATPDGGSYSGSGVSAGIFDPAIAGVGSHTITYTYADPASGCSNSCSFIITVNPNVSAGIVSGTSPLNVGQTATYTSDGTTGGTWSSSNTTVATVNATTGLVTALAAGTTDIIYTVSSGCGSPVSSFKTLTVNLTQNFSCGPRNDKVIVCHNGIELCLSPSAVAAHLAHGDILGPCPTIVPRSVVGNQETEAGSKLNVTAYPNPFEQAFKINIKSPVSGMATIVFYNTTGNKVFEVKQNVLANISNIVELKNTNMFKASVFYKVTIGDYSSTGIVVKQE